MDIAIIGSSGAGLPCSIFLKKKHPDWNVSVFDHNLKVGKKLLATGNGHCNLLNISARPEDYNCPEFLAPYFLKFPYAKLIDALNSLGIATMEMGDLVYPLSFSSNGYVDALASLSQQLGNRFHLGVRILDYKKRGNGYLLTTNCGDFACDKIIFATGGKSGKNLGSDGSLFPVFETHCYSISPLKPGLCPIVVKEDVSRLSGLRHRACVYSYSGTGENRTLVHEEEGEVLFKKDGLSGIVIFNTERMYAHSSEGSFEIVLDLFPDYRSEELSGLLLALQKANPAFAASFLSLPLFDYCLKRSGLSKLEEGDFARFAKTLKSLLFHPKAVYPFEDSQVTIGGIEISNLLPTLESKKEKGVFFLGEVLNVDGPCGGFNLEWCLISAIALASEL